MAKNRSEYATQRLAELTAARASTAPVKPARAAPLRKNTLPPMSETSVAVQPVAPSWRELVTTTTEPQRIPRGLKGEAIYEHLFAKCRERGETNLRYDHSWQGRLALLFRVFGNYRTSTRKGLRVVSYRTREARLQMAFRCFELIRDEGFKITDPANLDQRHVAALVTRMIRDELSDAEIQNRLSTLRTVCGWLGKKSVVLPTAAYATEERPLVRSAIAMVDRSWKGNGVEFEKVLDKAFQRDPTVGHILLVASAFGLRAKEALMFDPWKCDRGDHLLIDQGTKNGRVREVPVETVFQREVLDGLKRHQSLKRASHLGWKHLQLKSAKHKLYNELSALGVSGAELGVTFHGLRHEFCQELMMRHGLMPAIKGGTGKEMSLQQRQAVQRLASEALGHSRPGITATYAGSFSHPPTTAYRTTATTAGFPVSVGITTETSGIRGRQP